MTNHPHDCPVCDEGGKLSFTGYDGNGRVTITAGMTIKNAPIEINTSVRWYITR
jgi:hypothetical protein